MNPGASRVQPPSVRYLARPGQPPIAYTSRGRGSPFIVVPHVQMSHLGVEWTIPAVRELSRMLARGQQLVRYDSTGSGLSPAPEPDFSIAELANDITAVMDGLGFARAALFGNITGGLPAMHFAARHPGRVTHLVLWNSFASHSGHGMHPRMRALFAMAATDWELFTESISQAAVGWGDAEAGRGWAAVLRASTRSDLFLRYLQARQSWDVSDLLTDIRCPTLVLHDRSNQLASEERSRELAAAIPGAIFVGASSEAGLPDAATLTVIEEFIREGSTNEGRIQTQDLSQRELEVLRELATGATNAQIAERLSISINTVTRHLTHIYA